MKYLIVKPCTEGTLFLTHVDKRYHKQWSLSAADAKPVNLAYAKRILKWGEECIVPAAN